MKARFLHCADIHLGNRQYNHDTRYWDFSRAYRAVVDTALAERVDFVVLAGDLFHHRSVDPRTLSHAVGGLQRLRAAGIPVLAVEGNHERAYHGDRMGWMHFLADQDLLILLDLEIEGGDGEPAPLRSWDPQRRRGAYYEPLPGLRVYGLRYYGAGTSLAVERGAAALAAQDRSDHANTRSSWPTPASKACSTTRPAVSPRASGRRCSLMSITWRWDTSINPLPWMAGSTTPAARRRAQATKPSGSRAAICW
jgi:3',5'-cyclic AMP phosphodiesterase CpdA